MTNPEAQPLTAPDLVKNVGVVAQYCADIYVRMANQTAKVIADASAELGAGTYSLDDYFRTVNSLANIALLGWGELFASTMTVGGFHYSSATTSSKWYPVPGDPSYAHHVSVSPLSRSVSNDPIPKTRLGLESQQPDGTAAPCPNWVLPAGSAQFRLVLNQVGIHSGCYGGTAQVTQVPGPGAAAVAPTQLDVEVDV